MSTRDADFEFIRTVWREWNRHGTANPEHLHPEIEWIDPPEMPGGGHHIGRDDVLTWLKEMDGTVGIVNLVFEIAEIEPVGDEYLVTSLAEGKGDSGTPIPPHNWFHIVRVDDGTLRRAHAFLDRSAALEVAGLSE